MDLEHNTRVNTIQIRGLVPELEPYTFISDINKISDK